jgi:hypothetical protein
MGWRGSTAYRDSGRWKARQYPETPAGNSTLGISYDQVDIVSFAAIGAWSLTAGPVDRTPAPSPQTVTPAMVIATARQMQAQLVALGLYPAERIDGQVGPLTSAAAMRAYAMTRP